MVIIQGLNKFIIKEITETKPYFKATVEVIKAIKPKIDQRLKAMLDTMKELSMQIVNLSPNIPKEAGIALQNIEAPSFLVNFVASNLNIDVKEKQSILEINDLKTQIEVVMKHLNNELQILTIRNEIQSKVEQISTSNSAIIFCISNLNHLR